MHQLLNEVSCDLVLRLVRAQAKRTVRQQYTAVVNAGMAHGTFEDPAEFIEKLRTAYLNSFGPDTDRNERDDRAPQQTIVDLERQGIKVRYVKTLNK